MKFFANVRPGFDGSCVIDILGVDDKVMLAHVLGAAELPSSPTHHLVRSAKVADRCDGSPCRTTSFGIGFGCPRLARAQKLAELKNGGTQ